MNMARIDGSRKRVVFGFQLVERLPYLFESVLIETSPNLTYMNELAFVVK